MTSSIEDRQTQAFIDENPLEIVFRRRSRTETAEGGFVLSGETTLPPQTGRLVQSNRLGANDTRNIPDGRIVNIEATLVFLPGVDVALYDLVTIPAHGIGGDLGLSGEWEVGSIGGRWACDVGIFRHA